MFSFLAYAMETSINVENEQIEEKVNEVTTIFDKVKDFIVERGLSILMMLIFALLVLFVGKKVKKILIKIIKRGFEKSSVDPSVAHFSVKLFDVLFTLILIIAVVDIIGVDTSSLVALIGSAGLAVGLALQGSLANFAGGVLILIMKPFKIGDYIISGGVEGNVVGIDVFYTKLRTGDNRTIVIPNGTLSNASIENVTSREFRRVDLIVPVEYSADISKIRGILLDIADKNELVVKDTAEHAPIVFVSEFEASDIAIGFRCWAETGNYWNAKWSLQEEIKNTFDKEGISIPFNQLDINIKTENKID